MNKMRTKKTNFHLLFILFFCSAKIAFAQQDSSFFYTQYNSPLPNNNVTDILLMPNQKDKWVATWGGGITKFTGKNWQTFNTKNSAISSDFINEIKTDSKGNVWCATNQKGVDKFNGKSFIHFEIGTTNTVLCLGIDKFENVFAGSYNEGLFKLKNNVFEKIWGGDNALKYAIESICFDKENNLWMSTGKGIYFSSDKINFKKIIIDSTLKKQKVAFGITTDAQGNIWCATFPSGTLQKWNGKNWEIFEESATKFLKNKTSNPSKEYFKHAFYMDNKNNIYLSSQRNSLMRFDGLNWFSLTDQKQNNSVFATVAVDTAGHIFAGSWGDGMMTLQQQSLQTISTTDLSEKLNRKINDKIFLETKNNKASISVFDHGIVDGDEISVYVNDVEVINNYILTADKKTVEINLQPNSENRIVIVAHNLGSQPPNTTSIILSIDGNKKRYDLNNDLNKSAAIVIKTK
jgi:ligand-binding sensor domain-containing protein